MFNTKLVHRDRHATLSAFAYNFGSVEEVAEVYVYVCWNFDFLLYFIAVYNGMGL